ncbi:MAG: hypothetical protein FWG56_06240 [Desulfovibrionaceae bacterium]|jgi:hypothetical protein|nr:hypothetical protein [Desulfovibrionaceae bacterium]
MLYLDNDGQRPNKASGQAANREMGKQIVALPCRRSAEDREHLQTLAGKDRQAALFIVSYVT